MYPTPKHPMKSVPMKTYNKLVRDRIPEIIHATGKKYESRTIQGEQLIEALKLKLQEELVEFDEAHAPEELADILEVVHAIAANIGIPLSELEEIRRVKADSNGGFQQGIFLIAAEV